MNFDFHSSVTPAGSLPNALSEMEDAQLVRRLDESDPAYLFKHALVQDSVYGAMMRHDRKRLHRLVGEALERAYPERLGELASRLGEHFEEAGDMTRALSYFERAAKGAAAQYANREALAFYTRALRAANELGSDNRDSLHRARGQVYERIGEFDAACDDLETALEIARTTGDDLAKWQSLIDLGFVWLARDYARAGIYFEKALELARESNDELRVAQTLNRVGNWYLNNEEPQRALQYHNEALSFFEHMKNPDGLAETEDLLGMTNLLGSNMFAAREHFAKALKLARETGDTRGYITSLVSNSLCGVSLQGNTIVLPPSSGDREQVTAEILQLTRQVGWRAAEAQGLWVMAEAFAAEGRYDRSFDLLERSSKVAAEIEHRQWLAAATMVRGVVHAEILDFEFAQAQLEAALSLSQQLGSQHWIRTVSGFLASTYLKRNEITRADKILESALPPGTPARTLGQRQACAARVELALAREDAATALEWLDLLLGEAINLTPTSVIPHLWTLRARALLLQGEPHKAVGILHAASEEAHGSGQAGLEWRTLSVLAETYRAQGNIGDTARTETAALEVVNHLAKNVSDTALREQFIECATRMIRGG